MPDGSRIEWVTPSFSDCSIFLITARLWADMRRDAGRSCAQVTHMFGSGIQLFSAWCLPILTGVHMYNMQDDSKN